MVVGSNTHVAWGFTNSQADWNDLVVLELDPANHLRYRAPDGWRTFDRQDEVIEVAGGRAEKETVAWTIRGPVVGADHHGRLRALRWVAHDAERLGVVSRGLEDALSVDEAFDAVNGLARRARTSSSQTRAGTSAGRCTERCRGVSGWMGGCHHHGPTARRAGAVR